MKPRDPWVRPGPAGEKIWGYDGHQYEPSRRVSLSPISMLLAILRTDLEARGLLLTIFARYWAKDRPVPIEDTGALHLISKRKARRLIDELIADGLIEERDGGLVPAGPFGADPEEVGRVRAPSSRRSMPSDWSERREAVFERDGYACVYCGSGHDLHCDHVHPVALGGDHSEDNLVTACAPCNLSKGPKTLQEWRPALYEAIQRQRASERLEEA